MGVEILILTIYLICVVYVLYQMALAIEAKREDQYIIVLDGETLKTAINDQLQQQNIYQAQAEVSADKGNSLLTINFLNQDTVVGAVSIQVKPVGKRPEQPPITSLNVAIANALPNQQVFVNWDYSAISVFAGPGQRVIRQVPGRPTDLLQPQVATVVNPGLQTDVAVISEALLNRTDNQTALEVNSVLVDFSKIQGVKEPLRQYSIQMLVWVRSMTNPNSPAMQLLVPFNFRIGILPDHVALPVLSWLLKFNPFSFVPSRKPR
jgi:hypothetical protein